MGVVGEGGSGVKWGVVGRMECMDAAVFKCNGLCACQKKGISMFLSLSVGL